MTWLKSWLLAVTCAALVAALAEALSPEGAPKKLVRLAGGLLLLIAVLTPIRQIDPADLTDVLGQYQDTVNESREALAGVSTEVMKGIIAEETSAYILDKANALGLTNCSVQVNCRMSEGGFPVPDAVCITGAGEPSAWDALRDAITADFAIPPQRQTFERTDTP